MWSRYRSWIDPVALIVLFPKKNPQARWLRKRPLFTALCNKELHAWYPTRLGIQRERFSVEPSAASWNRNRSSAHKTAQQRDSLIPKSLERSKEGGGRTMTIYPCDWLPLLNLETSQLETRNNRKSKKLLGM